MESIDHSFCDLLQKLYIKTEIYVKKSNAPSVNQFLFVKCLPSALLARSHTVTMQSTVAAAKRAPEFDRAMQLKSERNVRNAD